MIRLVKNFLILNLGLLAFIQLMSWECEQYYFKYFTLNSLGMLIILSFTFFARMLRPRDANRLIIGLSAAALLGFLFYLRGQIGALSTGRIEFLILSFMAHAVPYLITALFYNHQRFKNSSLLSLLLACLGISSVLYGLLLGTYPGWVETGARFITAAGLILLTAVFIIPFAWLRIPSFSLSITHKKT